MSLDTSKLMSIKSAQMSTIRFPCVLIVDDDADDRELLTSVLSSINKDILFITAHDGLEALKAIEDLIFLPHLIMLDLNMPRMGGKDFLREIKRHPKFSKIPIYIYTTSADIRDQEETKGLGAQAYFVKPTNYSGVVYVATNVLSQMT